MVILSVVKTVSPAHLLTSHYTRYKPHLSSATALYSYPVFNNRQLQDSVEIKHLKGFHWFSQAHLKTTRMTPKLPPHGALRNTYLFKHRQNCTNGCESAVLHSFYTERTHIKFNSVFPYNILKLKFNSFWIADPLSEKHT